MKAKQILAATMNHTYVYSHVPEYMLLLVSSSVTVLALDSMGFCNRIFEDCIVFLHANP